MTTARVLTIPCTLARHDAIVARYGATHAIGRFCGFTRIYADVAQLPRLKRQLRDAGLLGPNCRVSDGTPIVEVTTM